MPLARPRHTHRLLLAYHGPSFRGFRRQAEGPTVEATVAQAIYAVTGREVSLACAGATDRGVHALGQVVSFHTREAIDRARLEVAIDELAVPCGATPFPELDEVLGGRSLRLRALSEAPRSFHASFSARARRYRFLVEGFVDADALAGLLAPLVGERCFSAFARDTPPGKNTIKRLLAARVQATATGLAVDLVASGFLRRQVRVMIATALREVERGATPEALLDLASRGAREETAPPAPAEQLCLWGVDYSSDDCSNDTGAPSLRPSTAPSVERSSSPEAAATQRSPS